MRKAGIFLLLALLFIAYGLFEGRKLIEGPRITIDTPKNGVATSSGLVLISGEAQNISFLTINDAPAYTDPAGHFSELYAPPSGYTVVTVAAVDKFGRRVSKSVSLTIINYCPLS